jgi:Family of unknown function (DUF5808)
MRSRRLRRLITLATWGVFAAAIAQEMKKDPEDREWHGTVGDLIPYDFRPPTAERIQRSLWDPDGPLFTPQVFGVGWAVNFGRLVAEARELSS